jgi:hypothetical protein|tara:strand:+ start:1274 stop:2071 length:798 start_codon:yes stop_codon:yes gene_type:complete
MNESIKTRFTEEQIKSARHINATILLSQKCDGNIDTFAGKVSRSREQCNSILREANPVAIGPKVAEDIEKSFKLKPGALSMINSKSPEMLPQAHANALAKYISRMTRVYKKHSNASLAENLKAQRDVDIDLHQVRRSNARKIVDSHCGGVVREFADRVGKSDRQCANSLRQNNPASFGDKFADDVEVSFDLKPGQLSLIDGVQLERSFPYFSAHIEFHLVEMKKLLAGKVKKADVDEVKEALSSVDAELIELLEDTFIGNKKVKA